MQHPLDGARLKIARAQEHIHALQAEIRMYLDKKPYALLRDQDRHTWTFRPTVNLEPPLRLSTLIGDCLGNGMAALDYVIWQLALKYFKNPPLIFEKDRRWVSFPIYKDRNDRGYVNKINRLSNREVPADAIAAMHRAQPDHTGQEPLWWLHELVNSDKHRLPLVTFAYLSSADMKVMREFRGVFTSLASASNIHVVSITDSTFDTEDPSIGNQMHVDCDPTICVALQDIAVPRIPADLLLQQIVECVANTIHDSSRSLFSGVTPHRLLRCDQVGTVVCIILWQWDRAETT